MTLNYVLGFATSHSHVVLIRKLNPAWQHGLLNGVGGKIEEGESPATAMAREFHEETGLLTTSATWNLYATLRGEGWNMHVFHCFLPDLWQCTTQEEERIEIVEMSRLGKLKVMKNLHWLIPMALNRGKDTFTIYEQSNA